MKSGDSKYLRDIPESGDGEIREILSVLGREDLLFLKKLRQKKRNLGITLAIIGFLIFAGSLYYFTFYGSNEQVLMWILFGWLIAISIVREGIDMALDANKATMTGGGAYKVVATIKCTKCEYTETKPFEPGDYVGKEIQKSCPKCGGKMKIAMIYGQPEREIKTVGMPILPGLGGVSKPRSITDRVTLTFLRFFQPIGIIFKWYRRTFEKEQDLDGRKTFLKKG